MGSFLQFRLWCREGPTLERVATLVAGIVVLALVSWALVPMNGGDSADETAVATGPTATNGNGSVSDGGAPEESTLLATGAEATGATATQEGNPVTGASSPGATSPAAASDAGPCSGAKLAASETGITPTEVRIAISHISLGGSVGNSTFNIREDLHQIAEAIVDSINKSGGVACGRKLVAKAYDVNPIDANDGQSKCLQMEQDRVFMVLDYGGYVYPSSRSCFVQRKLPFQSGVSIGDREAQGSYPYLFSVYSSSETQVRNWVFGADAMGVFSAAKGFKKLGILIDTCNPDVTKELHRALAQVGVGSDKISETVLDCTVSAPPQVAAAVIQHKGDGATNVFLASSLVNNENYVTVADQQSFRPIYGASDYNNALVGSGSDAWPAAFDGAVGITSTHSGEINSGLRNPKVDACNAMMTSHGVPPFKKENGDGAVLAYCDQFGLLVAALSKAGPNPKRPDLVGALATVGKFDSALFGDGLWNKPKKVTGGDFIRPIVWRADCKCFKLLEPNFKPGF